MTNTKEYDPKLKLAMKEIREVVQKYDLFVTVNLMSQTHGEVFNSFPTWSGIQHEGNDIIRIRMKQNEREKWEATAHLVAQSVVYSGYLHRVFDQLLDMLRKHALIGMPTMDITPHSPEMDKPDET